MSLQVTSTAFAEGALIPQLYTADGPDVSPPLAWSGAPAETQSLAIICDDPDAPAGTWVHWVLFGLRPDLTTLPEDIAADGVVPGGAKQGTNSFHRPGYGGPAPPPGPAHRYFFKVYALDTTVVLDSGATKADLEAAMAGHILAEGQLMGRYGR